MLTFSFDNTYSVKTQVYNYNELKVPLEVQKNFLTVIT